MTPPTGSISPPENVVKSDNIPSIGKLNMAESICRCDFDLFVVEESKQRLKLILVRQAIWWARWCRRVIYIEDTKVLLHTLYQPVRYFRDSEAKSEYITLLLLEKVVV